MFRLENIEDSDKILANGTVLQATIQSLLEIIALDIENACNACDAYQNERLICKVWKGNEWEEKFKEYANVFVYRRDQLTRALAAHAAYGIDESNRKLDKLETS